MFSPCNKDKSLHFKQAEEKGDLLHMLNNAISWIRQSKRSTKILKCYTEECKRQLKCIKTYAEALKDGKTVIKVLTCTQI